MRHLFSLAALLILLMAQIASAQSELKPGYIITNGNDTLRGMLGYVAFQSNPMEVVFQPEDIAPVTYKPGEIKSFYVDNKLYVSATVDIETSERELGSLSSEQALQLEKGTVFLRVIFGGSKKLYHYKRYNENDCFYTETANGIELLGFKKYIYSDGIKDYLNYNKKYIGQLLVVFKDYPELTKKIQKTDYTENSFTDLFRKYYAENEPTYNYYSPKRWKLNSKVGIVGGLSFGQIALKGTNWELSKYNYGLSITPGYGIFYKIELPKSKGRYAARFELDHNILKSTIEDENYINNDIYSTTTTKIIISKIGYNLIMSYLIPEKKGFWEVDLGLGFSRIGSGSSQTIESMYFGIPKTTVKKGILKTKNEFSLILGASYNYGHFGLGVRIEQGSGYLYMDDLDARTNRAGIVASFRF